MMAQAGAVRARALVVKAQSRLSHDSSKMTVAVTRARVRRVEAQSGQRH